jgi:outer membrane protein assembly factor BamB/predicted phosphohydrolase
MKSILVSLFLFLLTCSLYAQGFKFAHVSDTHIGSANADDDLRRTVSNINADTSLSFVVLTGDITDFGSDEEFRLAKQILDSLNKPWYIVPGNHDANWSESGTNSFRKIFGSETISFISHGYQFLGTVCGPNMRMSPGQVSRENIVWLDSTLRHLKDPAMPIIFLNHYPQDSALNNWYDVIDLLKTKNIQLILCGHGHSNHKLKFEGIPAIMGRSNLRAKEKAGGYNVVRIDNGQVTYTERNPLTNEEKKWTELSIGKLKSSGERYFRPSFAVNDTYKNVKTLWKYQDKSDIGSGVELEGNMLVASNSSGNIYALNSVNGRLLWMYNTAGKIYSIPAVSGDKVVVASTDNNIYCLSLKSGKLLWKFETQKPIVANAIISKDVVYIGSGDGHFRAINLGDGKLKWEYAGIEGFVVTKPLLYDGIIYFGTWGTMFYALDAATGSLVWKWNNGSGNRMFSPAACYPVATQGRLFIVAPDRYMTAFDAKSGKVLWRKQDALNRVRESMGMSRDSALVYAKTMDGDLIGVSATADSMQITWRAGKLFGYEIAPTAITTFDNVVYVPSDKGLIAAVNSSDGSVIWKHKISNSMISNVKPIGDRKVVVVSMDGKVVCLGW